MGLGAPTLPAHSAMGPQQAYHPKSFANKVRKCTEQCDPTWLGQEGGEGPSSERSLGVAGLQIPSWKKKLEGLWPHSVEHKVLWGSVCVPDSHRPVLD